MRDGTFDLTDFVRESNRIEGILREPTDTEIAAHETVLALPKLTVPDVQAFVWTCEPGAVLRDRPGLDVRVGGHIAPSGGPKIRTELEALLEAVNLGRQPRFAWMSHVAYETLHPFLDGNGRSGRVIWLLADGRDGARSARIPAPLVLREPGELAGAPAMKLVRVDRPGAAAMTGGCPHTNIVHCPLYIAAHEVGGYGCDDGRLGEGGCAADRGLEYATALGRLIAHDPRMVAECQWREAAELSRGQRARNMRAAGLH